jgi:hypothetical protein
MNPNKSFETLGYKCIHRIAQPEPIGWASHSGLRIITGGVLFIGRPAPVSMIFGYLHSVQRCHYSAQVPMHLQEK